jgi:hypothetical protein
MSGVVALAPVLAGEAAVPVAGWVLLGLTAAAVGGYLIYNAMSSANEHADAPPGPVQPCPNAPAQASAPPFVDAPGNQPPFTGVPGSTVRGGTGSRTYGADGYPQTNRDLPHPDEKGPGSGDSLARLGPSG